MRDLSGISEELKILNLYGELLYCSDNLKLSNFKEHVFNIYGDYGITLKFLYDDYIEGMIYK